MHQEAAKGQAGTHLDIPGKSARMASKLLAACETHCDGEQLLDPGGKIKGKKEKRGAWGSQPSSVCLPASLHKGTLLLYYPPDNGSRRGSPGSPPCLESAAPEGETGSRKVPSPNMGEKARE